MAALIEVTVNQEDQARLNRFILRLSDGLSSRSLREFVYTNARPHLQARAMRRFAMEGDDASGPWAPLRASTQRIRKFEAARNGWPIAPDHPINRRSGAFREYVTRTFDIEEGWREVNLRIPSARNTNAVLNQKLKSAQKGGTTRLPYNTKGFGGGLSAFFPPRPVAVMNENDQARLEQRFGAWVEQMLRTIT